MRQRHSKLVQILLKLGLIDEKQAPRVEELVTEAEDDNLTSSLELLIDEGVLTADQVEQVRGVRRHEDITGTRIDTFKRAHRALVESQASIVSLGAVATALIKK